MTNLKTSEAELASLLRHDYKAWQRKADKVPTTYIKLLDLSNKVNETLAPHTPCHRGCSACCYQAVGIPEEEARIIERRTGLKRVPQPRLDWSNPIREALRILDKLTADQQRYFRVPCTFLRGTECTIYEVRPIACRLHHSLADSPAPCSGDWDTEIPKLDLQFISNATAGLDLTQPVADIREWFPTAD